MTGIGTCTDKELIIPSEYNAKPVTSIDRRAFSGCIGLKSVTIPDSVTSIGNYAFYKCTGLTSVIIGNSVTSIGYDVFSGCTGLTSITIPNSVTSISDGAFYDCRNLQYIYITDIVAWFNISGLDKLMRYGSSNKRLYINNELATSITIPDGVTAIPSYAFDGCKGLTSVTIPNSMMSIGSYAFFGCTGLIKITGPSAVVSTVAKQCGSKSFEVVITSGTSIGSFSGCTGLTSVTIPNSVTSIDYSAFEGCNNLQDIYITDIGAWCNISGLSGLMFHSSSNKNLYINNELATSITIPDGVTKIPSSVSYTHLRAHET